MANIQINAGVNKYNASPLLLGTNRNHVAQQSRWVADGPSVLTTMKSVRAAWGSSEYGTNTFIYRIGHGPTDGRLDPPNDYMTGYHYQQCFEADGKPQGTYPYDDIKHPLNEAVDMGATPLMVVNMGTGSVAEAGALAAYCNRAVSAERTAKNAARANNPYNVKYWEIGNELSWDQVRGHDTRASSEAQYASNAVQYAKAIKQNSDIPVKVAIGSYVNANFTGNGWSALENSLKLIAQYGIYEGQQYYDAIMFHGYPSWPIAAGYYPGHPKGDTRLSKTENRMAVTSFQKQVIAAARTQMAPYLQRPVEFWNTEFFAHHYNIDDISMLGAVYWADWFCHQSNEGMPIAIAFCMWHNRDNFDELLFYQGNVNQKTPIFKTMQLVASGWGDATLPVTVSGSTTFTAQFALSYMGGANFTVDNVTATAAKSTDGKKVYVMIVNRSKTQAVPCTIDIQNFTWNTSQSVVVRTLRGTSFSKGSLESPWNATTLDTANWIPGNNSNTIQSPAGSVMILEINGQATPPNNGGGTTPPPPPPPPGPPAPPQIIQNPVPSQVPQLASIREAGASVTRLMVHWADIEPTKGVRSWFKVEQALHNARALGGRVVVTLFGTPLWASGAEENPEGLFMNPESWDDLTPYLQELVAKTKGQVIGYELWQAPNNPDFYYPSATSEERAEAYSDLLDHYTDVILEVDPDATIILGGMDTSYVDYLYVLNHLYVNNQRLKFHKVGLRAYTANDSQIWDQFVVPRLKDIRDTMNAYGDEAKQIVITGVAVGTEPHDQTLQAQRVARMLAILHSPKYKVDFACYDPYKDTGTLHRGLVTQNLSIKPAYGAYRTMAALLAGKVFSRELVMGSGNWGLEFLDALTGRSVYLIWTDREENSIPVEIPLRSNQIRLISVYNSKYADTTLLSQKLSFTLKKDVMIIQELDPVAVVNPQIPGSPVEGGGSTTPTTPINMANAKFELSLNGLCYLGATLNWLNESQLETQSDQWFDVIGHTPYIQQIQFDWSDLVDQSRIASKLLAIKHQQQIAMVTITLNEFNAPSTRAVGSGAHDTNFRALAQLIKAHAEPVFFRFIPDMNRSTSRASAANAVSMNGNDYIQAYLKVHDLFKQEAVTNAAWVWCPHVETSPNTAQNQPSAYYPGDTVVDWIGLDFFMKNTWGTYAAAFQTAVNFKDKPVLVCEFGVDDPDNLGYSTSEAINQFFDAIELKYTRVKGLMYFNGSKSSSEDYDLYSQTSARNAYQDRTGANRYITSGITL